MSALFDRIAARLKLSPEAAETWRERLRPRAPDGLSSRLLLLTVAFTLAVEALISRVGPAGEKWEWCKSGAWRIVSMCAARSVRSPG